MHRTKHMMCALDLSCSSDHIGLKFGIFLPVIIFILFFAHRILRKSYNKPTSESFKQAQVRGAGFF